MWGFSLPGQGASSSDPSLIKVGYAGLALPGIHVLLLRLSPTPLFVRFNLQKLNGLVLNSSTSY